ncbi:aldehyde dehydrogenase family protein [Mumia zhuanghuii]|uniref:Aldehyde dehydrogenase n=1 Tax=Mumia zhuanghuii TaxID=2585211 RepID=A0A5C4LY39_9ACTN|nr:aldehyde dehydrogenase family protein [Mumia zhuanghuii]TNC22021.1 aldehyde dehydrogenase [Mumia zhuanghuii]
MAGAEPYDPEVLTVVDPADGTLVGTLECASPAEVGAAVETAAKASPEWARTAPAERASCVAAAASRIAACADDLALLTTREMGKPLGDARGGVDAGVATLRQYAELGPLHRGRSLQGGWDATDLMLPQPRGVVAAITPWNDPVAVPCGLVGAALVTGNTVVLKPSERSPHTGVELARMLAEVLPPGVLQVLVGDGRTGAALAADPRVDVVAHVGSTVTGRVIAQAAARTGAKVLLENGGNDPMIVDAGVDPAWAGEQAALGAFANAGQICTAVERIYVAEPVAHDFLDALVRRAEDLVTGSGVDPATELGPLVDERMRRSVHDQVSAAVAGGARLLAGGVVPDGPGTFYPATVLTDCTDAMTVMREETFGPVAPVRVVPDFDTALTAAASGPYGLAAVVLTADMEHAQRAWRELPVGTVKVNAAFGGAPGGAAQPRGASGSGFGYGPELLDEMTTTKVVHLGTPRV